MKAGVPEKGDFIAVTFEPHSGHEQRGRRPALVVSNTLFNERTGLAIVCSLTRTARGFPFHVPVTDTAEVDGFVMAEQVKSIDFRARKAEVLGRATDAVLDEVLAILDACLF